MFATASRSGHTHPTPLPLASKIASHGHTRSSRGLVVTVDRHDEVPSNKTPFLFPYSPWLRFELHHHRHVQAPDLHHPVATQPVPIPATLRHAVASPTPPSTPTRHHRSATAPVSRSSRRRW
uniref:Uncharacterized protein n=1 Tax=Arundo donax TaxID=35708 RepID=A0A0A8XPF1_ARUDO